MDAFNDVVAPQIAILNETAGAKGLDPLLSPLEAVGTWRAEQRKRAEQERLWDVERAQLQRLAFNRHQVVNVYESAAPPGAPTRAAEAEQRRELRTILHSIPDEPGSCVGE